VTFNVNDDDCCCFYKQLLDIIQSTTTAESDLLAAMTVYSVAPDIDIFNAIIRRRNLRKDHKGARVS